MRKVSHSFVRRAALLVVVACFMVGASGAARALSGGGGDKQRARAQRAAREGEFATAEQLFRELLAKDGKDADARLGLSYTQLKQRNLRDAYDNAARVIALDPVSPRAHALLGAALLAAGDFALSIEEFRTALSLKDDEALAINGLSMINFYENRPQIAFAGLRRATYLDPAEPDFIFNFAQAAARVERYGEAADAYEMFLRIAPRTDADRRARIRGLIDFLRYLGSQRSLYQVGGADRSLVKFDLSNSRPVIEVRVNGAKQPLRFVLDTGSGMCVLSDQAAARIGVKSVARGGLARAIGGGGRFEIVYGFLTSLQVGEARIENVPVYIRPFHNTQEPVDGYLGLSVLAKFLAAVDYGAHSLSLVRVAEPRPESMPNSSPPTPPAATTNATPTTPATMSTVNPTTQLSASTMRGIELPIRSTSSGFWSGAVRVEGVTQPLNFIIDTGASISVVSTVLAAREEMTQYAQPLKIRVFGAAGVDENVGTMLLPRVTLGNYTHPNLTAAVLDMGPINETSGFEQTGIIGGNVLRNFRVTFDFQRALVRLEPVGVQPPTGDAPGHAPEAQVAPQAAAALRP